MIKFMVGIEFEDLWIRREIRKVAQRMGVQVNERPVEKAVEKGRRMIEKVK